MTESFENEYQHQSLESKWQRRWLESGIDQSNIDPDPLRRKHYALTMLPYPSGDLHMGHWYAMAPSDARARFMRMRATTSSSPWASTHSAPRRERRHQTQHPSKGMDLRQHRADARPVRSMGAMIDWRREMISADPEYYHGPVAVPQAAPTRARIPEERGRRLVPELQHHPGARTGVGRRPPLRALRDAGHPQGTGTVVFQGHAIRRELLDFSQLDWPERVQTLQRHWIGQSAGAWIVFETDTGTRVEVFTTRTDTLWGVTFVTLAPEHELARAWRRSRGSGRYLDQTARTSDIQRETVDREKTASSPAITPSARSPASAFRSGSPTTFWPATARARSWECRRTTSATSHSRRNRLDHPHGHRARKRRALSPAALYTDTGG